MTQLQIGSIGALALVFLLSCFVKRPDSGTEADSLAIATMMFGFFLAVAVFGLMAK